MSHLAQNGMVVGVLVSLQRMLSRIPPGVEQAPKGHYQLLRWNWGTPKPFDPPWWDAKMLAYGYGGRRRRSSQTPGCNGQDKVKDRQGKPVKKEANGPREEGR